MAHSKSILVYAFWFLGSLVFSQSVIAFELTTTDFIQFTSAKSKSEVAAAKYALNTSNSPAVRAFAQRVLDEQASVVAGLELLAQQEGIALDDPSAKRNGYVFIRKGETFDTAYAHKRNLELKRIAALLRSALFSENQAVRLFAEKTLPGVMQHWYEAQQLSRTLSNSAHNQVAAVL